MAFNPFDNNLTANAANAVGYRPAEKGRFALASYLGWVINLLLSMLGVIFTGLIVYGGYRWLTARGNDQQVEQAKGIIRHAIIGLFITVSAGAIWITLSKFLGA